MPRISKYKMNHAGIRAVLQSGPVASAIDGFGERIESTVASANEVTRNNVPVGRISYVTDRYANSVAMMHAAGVPIEMKYGTLKDAARGSGLEVRESGEL